MTGSLFIDTRPLLLKYEYSPAKIKQSDGFSGFPVVAGKQIGRQFDRCRGLSARTRRERWKVLASFVEFSYVVDAKQQYTVFAPEGIYFPERGGIATLLRCSCRCNPREWFNTH